MKIYAVGGCVRDQLLGVKPHDYDYVVVGSTHEEMISLGYTQVGASFPVYLHPETREEYALARKEVSTGKGHKDFSLVFTPDVTLEEDLERRDLTINSIAQDIETGEFIDPFNGINDIEHSVLRATSLAFAEDPLRILRVARFISTLEGDWSIDRYTFKMMKGLSEELIYIKTERRWAEFRKMISHPKAKVRNWFTVLEALGVDKVIKEMRGVPQPPKHHPEGDVWEHTMQVVEAGGEECHPIVRYGALLHDIGKPYCFEHQGNLHGHEKEGARIAGVISEAWGAPKKWRVFAEFVAEHHGRMHKIFEMKPRKVYLMIKAMYRRGIDIEQFIQACEMDSRGRGPDNANRDYPQGRYLRIAFNELNSPENKERIGAELSEMAKNLCSAESVRQTSDRRWTEVVSKAKRTHDLVELELKELSEILKGRN